MANLLVVEDNEAVRLGLEALLSVSGHEVRAVRSGEAALEAVRASAPHLIITDVVMPGISGLELLEAIRAYPDCRDIPFLVISASVTSEVEQQIAALEGVIYLRKPFDPGTLQKAVARALEMT